MIALDTNVIISALNLRPPMVEQRLRAALQQAEPVVLPAVALFELRHGVAKSTRKVENAHFLSAILHPIAVLAFESEDAEIAGALRATLEAGGTPIGHYDLLIAAQALRHGAMLVTANVREFARVKGLKVEDWSAG